VTTQRDWDPQQSAAANEPESVCLRGSEVPALVSVVPAVSTGEELLTATFTHVGT
jgi:hypothetical protein